MRKILALAVMGSMFAIGCGESSPSGKGDAKGGPPAVSVKPGATPPKAGAPATPPKMDGKSDPKNDSK
jgi:hypothetical protein